jgi:hypothetical protein
MGLEIDKKQVQDKKDMKFLREFIYNFMTKNRICISLRSAMSAM